MHYQPIGLRARQQSILVPAIGATPVYGLDGLDRPFHFPGRRRPGRHPWPVIWGRNLSRKVRETGRSGGQKRSEPPRRAWPNQTEDEHGGSPWLHGGSSRVGWCELLRRWVDDRVRRISTAEWFSSVQVEVECPSRHDARGRIGRASQQSNPRTSLEKTPFTGTGQASGRLK